MPQLLRAALATIALGAVVVVLCGCGSLRHAREVADVSSHPLQSVPWRLLHAGGRTVRLYWTSATCYPSVRPQADARVVQGNRRITISVYARVAKATPNELCAGVGLAGNLTIRLHAPVGQRTISHGPVTDRDR